MQLMRYQNDLLPMATITPLLSDATGLSDMTKLHRTLQEMYRSDAFLYVLVDAAPTAASTAADPGELDALDVCGLIGFRCTGADSGEILHIAVNANRRRQGLGRKLVDAVIRLHPVIEIVAETDEDAVGFYRRCGFAITPLGQKYPGVARFLCRRRLEGAQPWGC